MFSHVTARALRSVLVGFMDSLSPCPQGATCHDLDQRLRSSWNAVFLPPIDRLACHLQFFCGESCAAEVLYDLGGFHGCGFCSCELYLSSPSEKYLDKYFCRRQNAHRKDSGDSTMRLDLVLICIFIGVVIGFAIGYSSGRRDERAVREGAE